MEITADRLPPWARRLIPSFADYLFLLFLIAHAGPQVLSDADTGWHLLAGYARLARGLHAIPEPLSWTRSGVPWWSPQWIPDLAFALAHRHGRFVPVVLLATAAYAVTFSWLYRLLLRDCRDVVVALGVTLLASATTWPHLLARPEIFAFPLFLLYLRFARDRARGRARLVLLPALAA